MVATNVAKLYSQRIFIYENIKNAAFLIAGIIIDFLTSLTCGKGAGGEGMTKLEVRS